MLDTVYEQREPPYGPWEACGTFTDERLAAMWFNELRCVWKDQPYVELRLVTWDTDDPARIPQRVAATPRKGFGGMLRPVAP